MLTMIKQLVRTM